MGMLKQFRNIVVLIALGLNTIAAVHSYAADTQSPLARLNALYGVNVPRKPHKDTSIVQIPFEQSGNTMLIHAMVGGAHEGVFVVDTGASDTIIFEHFQKASEIPIPDNSPSGKYVTANGIIQAQLVLLDIQVGNASLPQLRVGISKDLVSTNIDGIIGMNFFKHFKMEIDNDNKIITLKPNADS